MDRSATFDELSEHIASLRKYAWSLTRCSHRADDLVQETLVRAVSAAATLRPGAPVRPWLFRILHNAHVSDLRRQKVRDAALLDASEADEASDAPQIQHVELQRVLTALAELPEAQREVISLIALEDLTYAEAAHVLGIPMGTLMSRLARGREALRQALAGKPPARLRVVGGQNDD
jgi:RNA polymerase sigma factor (sigma-70 family)